MNEINNKSSHEEANQQADLLAKELETPGATQRFGDEAYELAMKAEGHGIIVKTHDYKI